MIRHRDEGADEPPRLRTTVNAPASLRAALQAAHDDRPDPKRLALIAAHLPFVAAGIATGIGVGSTAAAGSAIAEAGGSFATFGQTLKSKLLLGGLVAALTAGGIAGYLATRPNLHPNIVQRPIPAIRPNIVALQRPETAAVALPEPQTPPRETARKPSRINRPLPPTAAPSPPTPSPQPVIDVAAETRLLQSAKAALAHRPAETLRLVDEHARRFPSGILAQEREVIAIEALLRTEKNTEARARAHLFMKAYPKSAHLRRVAALLEGGR